MRPSPPPCAIDLRGVADRLSRAFPGRVFADRPADALFLSALPGWWQGEDAFAAGSAEIALEPSVVVKPSHDGGVGGEAFTVRVRVSRAIGRGRRYAGDGLDRYEADVSAAMARLGLAPRATEARDNLHLFRTRALDRDVLAVSAALLSRVEPVEARRSDRLDRPAVAAPRPGASELPELSRNIRAGLLAALARRERAAG